MNTMKTFLLMAALTLLLVVVGNILVGQSGMMFAFLFAVVRTHPPIEERVARLEAIVYGENSRWVFHHPRHG